MANRLHLDFSLETSDERSQFLNSYVQTLGFKPTADEMETMANYVLFGRDVDGKNAVQKHNVQIETRSKTWNPTQKDASLDELCENPGFNEANLKPIGTLLRPKVKREVFQREEARTRLSDLGDFQTLGQLEELWDRIDELELLVSFWEVFQGKRTKPIREFLVGKFGDEEQNRLRDKAKHLNQYQILKVKHLLVELRREQYTITDTYKEPFVKKDFHLHYFFSEACFGSEIPVFPLGLASPKDDLFFQDEEKLCSGGAKGMFGDEEFKRRSRMARQPLNQVFFDFRELEHVYNLVLLRDEILVSSDVEAADNTISLLVNTLDFYIRFARLDEMYQEILDMKMRHMRNPDIAKYVNEKYGKSYTANYISTIFRQKIIKQICEAAELHERIVDNLMDKRMFKQCTCCGRFLLIDEYNFVHKSRARDGFANRCKECDRKDRQRRKKD